MTETQGSARLLLVDDDEAACRLLGEVLERERYRVVRALSVPEATARLDDAGPFDAVLTDLRMPGASGLDLLRAVRERDPSAIVLVLTAFGDATTAAEAIRAGAHDFISKPYDIDEVRLTLSRALRRRALPGRAADARAVAERDDQAELIGHSPAIISVMKTVARAAPTQASMLILGETGTGKELVARTVHGFSERAAGKFVAVNCSALAEGLLESELFGHVRGAFTGAAAARPGLFREADRGTLFLDEIGDISPGLQSRLLRVLQEHEIVPVGSETPVRVDVRVIAATHRDLAALVKEGKFREDLYYRLNVVAVSLAPLRERRQDIPLLIDHFLRRLARQHDRGPVAVDSEAQTILLAYDWPGNVRELQNVLERAVVLAEQDVVGPEHLPAELRAALAAAEPARTPLPGSVAAFPLSTAAPVPPSDASADLVPLAEVERRHVLRVLESTGGNRERAARILRISRRTLTRMLQRWELSRPRH